MKRLLAAVAMVMICGGAAMAEFRGDLWNAEWLTYRTFLTEPACGEAQDIAVCETRLNTWRRDLMWAVDPSFGGLLIGQRNLAYCFDTGCDGAVKPNPLLACAWASVVANGGQPQIEGRDLATKRELCGKLEQDARDAAEAQAKRLLKMIYV